ncbi:hypothetical protein MANES_07G087226v8 [Manihot esculenta]|uniref:Uncharacterized protein n=1 Tax=Manihot esculenta TaxID=3983 RepID=A0ACB7HH64_MANES|nr:hypothetical protein MANES_07G087226v8 [Manihot esculenta]
MKFATSACLIHEFDHLLLPTICSNYFANHCPTIEPPDSMSICFNCISTQCVTTILTENIAFALLIQKYCPPRIKIMDILEKYFFNHYSYWQRPKSFHHAI